MKKEFKPEKQKAVPVNRDISGKRDHAGADQTINAV
jgi:hypothetical protein